MLKSVWLLVAAAVLYSNQALAQRSPVICDDATLYLSAFSNGTVRTDNIHIVWSESNYEVFGFPVTWREGNTVYYKLAGDREHIIAFDKVSKDYWLNGTICAR